MPKKKNKHKRRAWEDSIPESAPDLESGDGVHSYSEVCSEQQESHSGSRPPTPLEEGGGSVCSEVDEVNELQLEEHGVLSYFFQEAPHNIRLLGAQAISEVPQDLVYFEPSSPAPLQ